MSETIYSFDEIAAIVQKLLNKYHAEKALLFGSYARNEANNTSDIDLVIYGGEFFEPTDVFCIADELYRALKKNVDVYEIREIDNTSDFYHTILRDGIMIA